MSEAEEHKSLLASSDDGVSLEDDSFAAMQQIMGFSSFSGVQKPKRQPRNPGPGRGFGTGANSQPIQPRTASTSKSTSTPTPKSKPKPAHQTTPLSATSHPFIPASLPPHISRSSKSPSPSPTPSQSQPTFTPAQDAAYFKALNPLQATASPSPPRPHPTTTTTASASTSTALPFNPSLYHTTTTGTATQDPNEIAYTHPRTGYTFTRAELQAYERGVVEDVMNNDGSISQVKVYFKPSFVVENPWEELEGRSG